MMDGFGLDPIPRRQRLLPETTHLVVLNGPQKNRLFPLTQMRSLVGRNDPPHCRVDIDLNDCELSNPPMVSRRHALLQWQDGSLQIRDLGSRNGTFINEKKLDVPPNQKFSEPVALEIGSRIRLGNIQLEVINRE